MKRRNAESGKMRRPIKRTKITEGMYGNSLLYLKFVMLWATVVMADHMLEFRFEFLWPFWMLWRSVYETYKYHGLTFSVFFICIAVTSDIICYFFMPISWMFIVASTYVWMQCIWYTVSDKGICLPTLALCVLIAYVEGLLRASERGSGATLDFCRPLAAHCVGYPAVSLGFGFKSYVTHRLRVRKQRADEFYVHLFGDATSDGGDQHHEHKYTKEDRSHGPMPNGLDHGRDPHTDHKHMNGSAVRKKVVSKVEQNGSCQHEHNNVHAKLERLSNSSSGTSKSHSMSNGSLSSIHEHDEDNVSRHDTSKASAKSSRSDKKDSSTQREEKKKNKNRDKDKDKDLTDSHKSTESKESTVREYSNDFSTKETTKSQKDHTQNHKEGHINHIQKDSHVKENGHVHKESNHMQRENSHTQKEKEREKEREREREREREMLQREAKSCMDELRKVRQELDAARNSESELRKQLAEAISSKNYHEQMSTQLQNKLSAWRTTERTTLERRVNEERRARRNAEGLLLKAQQKAEARRTGECDNETCQTRLSAAENEGSTLKRELQRSRDRITRLQRDLTTAAHQLRSLEARQEETGSPNNRIPQNALQSLQERAAHLERSLSSETKFKLDLLSAYGEAKRQLNIREVLITQQEKEIAELKAQMLAVMPTDFVTTSTGVTSATAAQMQHGVLFLGNTSAYESNQLLTDYRP